MFNPNEYDEASYHEAQNALVAAVSRLWYSGAEYFDIEQMCADALADVTDNAP